MKSGIIKKNKKKNLENTNSWKAIEWIDVSCLKDLDGSIHVLFNRRNFQADKLIPGGSGRDLQKVFGKN